MRTLLSRSLLAIEGTGRAAPRQLGIVLSLAVGVAACSSRDVAEPAPRPARASLTEAWTHRDVDPPVDVPDWYAQGIPTAAFDGTQHLFIFSAVHGEKHGAYATRI